MSKRKKYAARVPLAVRGGIRSQTPHGGALRAWWGRRWTEALERFRIGARLGRGRSYAVAGQVSELEIAPGRVEAHVQGGDKIPYQCSLNFRMLDEQASATLIADLRRAPVVVARLLVRELPFEVENIFDNASFPLFPRRQNDIQSRCSCPDYANPCKHLAAVYYLLGEAITHDPLLLLELRGISREALLGSLAHGAAQAEPIIATRPPATAQSCAGAPVHVDPARFYGQPRPPCEDLGSASKSSVHAPLVLRLGALPFWRGQERFMDTLEHLYARAAPTGWTAWSGEPLDLRTREERIIVKGDNLNLRNRRLSIDTTFG